MSSVAANLRKWDRLNLIPPTMPTAYKEGEANFYGYEFKVNRQTFIPRPETEQLVERVLKICRRLGLTAPKIVDVGTGSGVIACTLKKLLPRAKIVASDNSVAALAVARHNARRLGLEISFRHGNLLDGRKEKFDVVIANLPYVPASRWAHLSFAVRQEPRAAIVAGRDGLKWIRLLIRELPRRLTDRSLVALEIDDFHSRRVARLLQQTLPDYNCRIERDLANKDRFAFAVPK